MLNTYHLSVIVTFYSLRGYCISPWLETFISSSENLNITANSIRQDVIGL